MKFLKDIKANFGVLHHFHVRKRVYNNLEPFPHPDRYKNFLDKVVYVVSFLVPFVTLPQAYAIWSSQNAQGVSFISWFGYFFNSIIWFLYGLEHKEKPIVIMNLLAGIFNFLVILGILVYG